MLKHILGKNSILPFIYNSYITFEVYILSFKPILLSDAFHVFETWTFAMKNQIYATGAKYVRYYEGKTSKDRIRNEMFSEGEIKNLLILRRKTITIIQPHKEWINQGY
jgi:hypothetical protein